MLQPLLSLGSAAGARMEAQHYVAQAIGIYVRVNLGGRNAHVAQHFLNAANVSAIFQQVRGKAVP